MIKTWFKTLFAIIRLRYIVGYNGFIYKLKLLPVIGKLLPDDLYKIGIFKVLYSIWKFIAEIFKLFALKIAGLSAIYGVCGLLRILAEESPDRVPVAPAEYQGIMFILSFLTYGFMGMLINTDLFSYSPEKEYAAFMLRMDARKLNNSLFAYNLAALFIAYSGVSLVCGPLSGMPFYYWLFTALIGVLMKLAAAGLQLASINLKRRLGMKIQPGRGALAAIFFKIMFGFSAMMAVLLIAANAICPPAYVPAVIVLIIAVLAVIGLFLIKGFDPYMHRRLLSSSKEVYEIQKKSYKNPDRTKSLKKVDKVRKSDRDIQSKKTGFAFLNEIFMKRYRTVIGVKPFAACIGILLLFALFATNLFVEYSQDFGQQAATESLVNNIFNYLTFGSYQDTLKPVVTGSTEFEGFFRGLFGNYLLVSFFFLVPANATEKMAATMFINCDRCLMSYSFYKKPSCIVELFKIRILDAIKLNLSPAITLGIVSSTMMFMFGGQSYFGEYLLIPLAYMLISSIYSVQLMTLYYLFQPFTENVKVKSRVYPIITVIIFAVVLGICWIPIPAWLLVPILAGVLALTIFVAIKLVRKFSPKYWRVRT